MSRDTLDTTSNVILILFSALVVKVTRHGKCFKMKNYNNQFFYTNRI